MSSSSVPVNQSGRFRQVLLALLWGFLCAACFSPVSAAPKAESGVIDFRSQDFAASGIAPLDGDWEFYPGQLLDPESFSGGPPPPGADFLSLPNTWNHFEREGRSLDGRGMATFRLRLLMPERGGNYALRIYDVAAAYRLWLNGELLAQQGVVADQAAREVARPNVDLPVFHNDGEAVELVLQISNHLYPDGGVSSSILLGPEQAIKSMQLRSWGIALFFVGCLFMMGCYHLILFCFRSKNSAPLYFGGYCLAWAGNFILSSASDWVIRLFLPEIAVESLHRFDSIFFFASVPVGFMFFHALFPDEFSSAVMRVSQLLAGFFVLLAIFLGAPQLLDAVVVYYLISLVLIVYCLLRLFTAWRSGREGAGFILCGFALLGAIAANDMLFDLGLIHSVYLIHVGIFLFIVAQGFALSFKLSRAFTSVEQLSAELASRNRVLEQEMQERARLEQEIVNVTENERRLLSRDLHDGLCQQLTAARLHCAVLDRRQASGASDELALSDLSRLLDESVNLAYGLARGLWPVDNDPQRMSAFLDDYCQQLARTHGLRIEVHHVHACFRCDSERVTQIYRIAQEAIANAVKHARASLIVVKLEHLPEDASLLLSVIDDGVGRQPGASSAPGGLGMRIMAHRARMIRGEFQVADGVAGGTAVTCKIHCAQCPTTRTHPTGRSP